LTQQYLLTLPLLITRASLVLADADTARLAKCEMDRNGVMPSGQRVAASGWHFLALFSSQVLALIALLKHNPHRAGVV